MVNDILAATPKGNEEGGEEADVATAEATGEESAESKADLPITPDFFTARPKKSRFRR